MWTLPFCLALLVTGQPDDPGHLVARLTDAEASARIEAADRLEMLGLDALPALRAAAGSDDPELSRRARGLAGTIRATRLLRPSLVAFEASDLPLSEAVAALRQRSGFPVVLSPEDLAGESGRRVTVETAGPVPFWKALDQLAAAGGVHVEFERPFGGRYPDRLAIRLVDGATPETPIAHAGPYRLALTSLVRHRQVAAVLPPATAEVRQEFTANLVLAAEPDIWIAWNGPIRLLEAIDDQGRDLRPASTERADSGLSRFRSWDQPEPSTIAYPLPLDLPAGAEGGRIARLAGYVPIAAVGRVDEILSFPLADAAGKTFSAGGIAIEVRSVEGEPIHSVQLVVRGLPMPPREAYAPGPHQISLTRVELPFVGADHIRIEDSEGRPLSCSPSHRPPLPGSEVDAVEVQVHIRPARTYGPPALLRFHGTAAVATEVPFRFTDLPIP